MGQEKLSFMECVRQLGPLRCYWSEQKNGWVLDGRVVCKKTIRETAEGVKKPKEQKVNKQDWIEDYEVNYHAMPSGSNRHETEVGAFLKEFGTFADLDFKARYLYRFSRRFSRFLRGK